MQERVRCFRVSLKVEMHWPTRESRAGALVVVSYLYTMVKSVATDKKQ